MKTKAKADPAPKFIPVRALPLGKVIKGTFIKMRQHGRTYLLADSGTLYSTGITGNSVLMMERDKVAASLDPRELQALKRLGILSAEEVRTSLKAQGDRTRRREIERKNQEFISSARRLGVPEKLIRQYVAK